MSQYTVKGPGSVKVTSRMPDWPGRRSGLLVSTPLPATCRLWRSVPVLVTVKRTTPGLALSCSSAIEYSLSVPATGWSVPGFATAVAPALVGVGRGATVGEGATAPGTGVLLGTGAVGTTAITATAPSGTGRLTSSLDACGVVASP